ncbi:MAG: AAA family ATPase [Cytophagales bacterium]|nr:AAA family ATPase [Cytophagales bacterium]
MNDNIIKFEGLKGVGSVELALRPDQRVYTFIGTNGVGKTKVLEALFQTLLWGSKLFTQNVPQMAHEINIVVAKKTFYLDQYALDFSNARHIRWENPPVTPTTYEKKSIACVFIGAQARGQIFHAPPSSKPIGAFESRRAEYLQHLVITMQNDFSRIGMNEDIQHWFVARAQSANPYQKSTDNRRIEIDALLKALHEIDNRFSSDFLEIDGSNQISVKIENKPRKITELSSGFTSLLKILQAIISGYANFTNEVNLTHVRGIVLIDEIESHLHVEWQSKIVPLLKGLFPNTTFYIATHSSLVLAQLQEGEAYQLARDPDGVVRSRLIESPNKKVFSDVLKDAFGIDLNALKREQMTHDDQTNAKAALLALMNDSGVAV